VEQKLKEIRDRLRKEWREGQKRDIRERLLACEGVGVMQATKRAREFVAAVKEVSSKAKKEDLESVEFELEEMLQKGELKPSELEEQLR
jgi:benzoyl-CoA reductase/2-hydroxyglutaryl-CoA dehydratase subunit BcrC/BadD/HgdB